MFQTLANQHADIAEDCLGMELDIQSLEMVENFGCFSGTIGATEDAFESVISGFRRRR